MMNCWACAVLVDSFAVVGISREVLGTVAAIGVGIAELSVLDGCYEGAMPVKATIIHLQEAISVFLWSGSRTRDSTYR